MTEDKPRKGLSYLPRFGAGPREKKTEAEHPPTEPPLAPEDSVESGDVPFEEPITVVDEPEAVAPDDVCAEEADESEPRREDAYESEPLQEHEEPEITDSQDEPLENDSQGIRPSTTSLKIVGVRFGCAGKIYHFDAAGLELKPLDWIIVKTEKGIGLARVTLPPFDLEVEESQLDDIRKVIRQAEKADFEQKARCENKEADAFNFCLGRISALGLPMKLVSVECYFDQTKYVFYFTAEGRVDFRELVKQLVSRFPVRIEMRQIGVRHEAKMIGGIACCGQELCCARFLTEFKPVSVKMAKNQNLSLNPTKISGVCGRLMCCLAFEHEIYDDFKRGLPKVGKSINTVYGEGVIIKHNPLDETISVRIDQETCIEISKGEVIGSDTPQTARKKKVDSKTAPRPRSRRKSGKPSQAGADDRLE
jgi:cell fate regulator YaaT (PSP1 superfamily)